MPRAIRTCPNRRSGLWSDVIGHAMACPIALGVPSLLLVNLRHVCIASRYGCVIYLLADRKLAAILKTTYSAPIHRNGLQGGARCRSMQFFKANNAMDLNQAIIGRRAVRGYTKEAIDERTIRGLVDAAVHAPSAVNQQPWAFTVVRDQRLLDQVSRDAKSYMLASMPASPHSDHFQSLLSDPTFQIFYHAPVLILISALAQGPWIVEDCALAAENLMLAAYAAGLGSCWIGFAQSFLNTSDGKKVLGLPAAWVSVAPIIVGHPKAAPPPVPRKEPEVRWVG